MPIIWIILDAVDARVWKDMMVFGRKLGEVQLNIRGGNYENDICERTLWVNIESS